MNNHYTYLLILLASLAGPLALSFDKKVAFYKKWKYLPLAILLPAIVYIVWDFYFVSKGVWTFNPKYITGIYIYNLPLEEVLFFFVVPYCCLFIYECIRCYFPRLKDSTAAVLFLGLLAIVLMVVGFTHINKYYTGWTFLFTAEFILMVLLLKKVFIGFDALSFLVSFIIVLIPFLIVNGFLTSIPVVIYNDTQNLGIRIYTIPFEDVFYGMLLVLMNISIFEKLRSGKKA